MIVNTQTRAGMGYLNMGYLHGLGECPSYAPYPSSNGGCSNVPPGVSTDPGSFGQPIESTRPDTQPYTGYGYGQAPSGGYSSGALDSSYSAAQAKIDALKAQAASLGVPVSCSIYTNSGPGVPALYGTDCTVAGTSGHDAGLLLNPGGLRIALAESAYASGNPYSQLPVLSPVTSPATQTQSGHQTLPVILTPAPSPSQAQASANTNKPNQSVPPVDRTVPLPTSIPRTGNSMYTTPTPTLAPAATGSGPSDLWAQLTGGLGSGSGESISPVLLIAGAGLALYFLSKGGR